MGRFILIFLLMLLLLFGLELTRPVQEVLVLPWTEILARISAWLVQLFDSRVESSGIVLRNAVNGFAVSIEPGCNGVEATIVLLAAIVAFPTGWRRKLLGFLVGFVAIQGLNLVRVISLFYLGQWNATAFEWAHLYVWQGLIMLDAFVVYLLWLRTLPRSAPAVG